MMDMSMRTLRLLSLVAMVVMGTAFPVRAQEVPQQPQTPVRARQAQGTQQPAQGPGGDRGFFFNLNFGGQAREQSFTESATFSKYNETGAVATTHAVGGGALIDLSVGTRVWRNVGVAIGYSSFKDDDDAGITARVPHPVLFGSPRTETVTASGLEHSENVVHLQFMWTIPYRDRFQLALIAGPSFFTVRQDLATVRAADIQDPSPLIRSITITEVKESTVGFNIGADGSYRITEISGVSIGVGLFARYVGASVDLPEAAGATIDDDLQGGGFQGGGGLRLGF
jgi:hypothetical protein